MSDYAQVLQAGGLHGSIVKTAKTNRPTFQGGESVLLHYSGYGYSRRGAPLWLLEWLREERPRIGRLGVFFHELYATGPPWKSEFWLSPLQRHVARQIVALSDFWITNRQASADWLNIQKSDKAHATLPIPSGVGEISPSNFEREPLIVIFGGAGLRASTYMNAKQQLGCWGQTTGLSILDIGPPITDSKVLQLMRRIPVHVHGRLSAEAVSKLLARAQFGLVTYPLAFASKSSVIGAYCAHGLCPIILSKGTIPSDGLTPGENCLTQIPGDFLSPEKRTQIAQLAHYWYLPHAVKNHVKKVSELFGGVREK